MARLWKLISTHEYEHSTETSNDMFRIEIFAESKNQQAFRVGLSRWDNFRVRQTFVDDPGWVADEYFMVKDKMLESEELTASGPEEVLSRIIRRLQKDGYDTLPKHPPVA